MQTISPTQMGHLNHRREKVTRVTDARLPHLYKMSELREIDLTLTRVTDKGVAALKKALPWAKITYSGASEPAAETEKLRGSWRGELVLPSGDKGSKREFFLFIAGNDMSLGGLVLDRFTLHPDRKPKGIDLEPVDNIPGFNNGPHNRGIYRLEGDSLTLCMGRRVRPREFSSEAKGVLLYTFKRQKVSVLDDIEALEKLGGGMLYRRPEAGPDFTMVVFGDRPGLSDAEWKEAVALLRKHPEVPALSLSFTQVTDARLASLKELPGLRRLYLKVTRVTDAGLRHLQKMPALREIDSDSLIYDIHYPISAKCSRIQAAFRPRSHTEHGNERRVNLGRLSETTHAPRSRRVASWHGFASRRSYPAAAGAALAMRSLGISIIATTKKASASPVSKMP